MQYRKDGEYDVSQRPERPGLILKTAGQQAVVAFVNRSFIFFNSCL
jgi:hypothetical protein